MPDQPKRIYLLHAMSVSMAPIVSAFESLWPQARIANVLDDSLYADLGEAGRLTDELTERCRVLARYCAAARADAIVFTGSAFGPALDVVKRDQRIPFLKPNEALYDELMERSGRTALLATFAPTLPSMMAEIEAQAREAGRRPDVRPYLVDGALDALMAGNRPEHDRLIVEAACARAADHDLVALAQVSMSPAAPTIRARIAKPLLTTPETTIAKLKRLLGAA